MLLTKRDVMVTTTPTLEGWSIETYLDTISAHVVAGTNIFSDFFASLTDIFGGRSGTYQKQLASINEEAIQLLRHRAKGLGANCVLGLKIDHDEVSGGGKNQMFMVTAVGTAVVARPCKASTSLANKSSDSIGGEYVELEVSRQLLIDDARDDIWNLSQEQWELAITGQVEEVGEFILAGLTKVYEGELAYMPENHALFLKYAKEYFLRVDPSCAKPLLYELLVSHDRSYTFAEDTLKNGQLIDYESATKVILGGDLDVAKRVLPILLTPKAYYTCDDVDAIRRLLDVIEDNFQPAGQWIESKGRLSSKVVEKWQCQCGTTNKHDREYCKSCGQDMYGFKSEDVKPDEVRSHLEERLMVLEKVLGDSR